MRFASAPATKRPLSSKGHGNSTETPEQKHAAMTEDTPEAEKVEIKLPVMKLPLMKLHFEQKSRCRKILFFDLLRLSFRLSSVFVLET